MTSSEFEHVGCWVEIDDKTRTALFQSASFAKGGAIWMSFDALRFGEEFFALPVLRMWTHGTINLMRSANLMRGADSVAFETYGSGTLHLRRNRERLLVSRKPLFRGRPEIGTGALTSSLKQFVAAVIEAHRGLASQVYRVIPEHICTGHAAWQAIQEDRTQLKRVWRHTQARR